MLKQIENFGLSLKGRNLSAHTLRAYESDLEAFAAFMNLRGWISVKDFNLKNIRKYLSYESEKELSRAAVLRKISALRSFARFLANRGLIKVNPFTLFSARTFCQNPKARWKPLCCPERQPNKCCGI